MKKLMIVFLVLCCSTGYTQVAINTDGNAPHASAMLDVKSNNKGVLFTRMTTAARQAITSPANGLMVYDTTTNSIWYNHPTGWKELKTESNAAYGNNIRFACQFYTTITDGYVTFTSTQYNLNPTMTVINPGNITINKTGLYHLEGRYVAQAFYSLTPASAPRYSMRVELSIGTGGALYDIIESKNMPAMSDAPEGFILSDKFSMDLHLTAGTIVKIGLTYFNSGTSTKATYGDFTGYLISE